MARHLVAISGPDNVGKSTQLRMLARRFPDQLRLAGNLQDHEPRWEGILQGELATWWFEDSTITELVDVLATSYLARHKGCATGINLIDRGIPMLEATLAATVAVRDNLDPAAASARATDILRPYAQQLAHAEAAELGIVLLHSTDITTSVTRSLAREAASDVRYRRYQECLAQQILWQVEADRYQHVILADQPILAVQAELRRAAFGAVHPALARCSLADSQVVAFGGLSESGKSTAAAWMSRQHGHMRLKIGYLLQQAATRHGIDDVYAIDDGDQAALLVDELDRFAAAHPFANRITIESLHRFDATAALKQLLGGNLTIVYIDADEQTRRTRGVHGGKDVITRDAIKSSRGADRIKDIADLVLGNDASLLALRHRLDLLNNNLTWTRMTPKHTPAANLALPERITTQVAELTAALTAHEPVDLIAVTGSGGRGKYQDGWSDIDILIIADVSHIARVKNATDQLRTGLSGVKLGLTFISSAECNTGLLSPRLTHTLRQIASGDLGVQWHRPDLRLPLPSHGDDERHSLQDGRVAAIEIRRQMLRPIQTRSLFKVTALLAKVMLRIEGNDSPDDIEALRTFIDKYLDTATAQWLATARHDPDAGQRLAFAVLNAWLSTAGEAMSP